MIGPWQKRILVLAGLLAAVCWQPRKVQPGPPAPPPTPEVRPRPGLQCWAFRIARVLAGLGVGGFVVAASGLIPITASSGHWAITAWFLDFAKNRSVATRTLGLKVPSLREPWLVEKGAGHYESFCRPCHGSPSQPSPRVAQRMTPAPPDLAPSAGEWNSAGLFYMVKHGIKFTGMPAWPSLHRDDEVWAMVAFLRELPDLDAARYLRLANGDVIPTESPPREDLLPPVNVARTLESCARCHGLNGLGRGSAAFPKLASQRPEYLLASLQAYARAERHSGMMEPIAAGLSSENIRDLALYYSQLTGPATPPAEPVNPEIIEQGRRIAHRGIPGQRVPACAACHGPSTTPRNPIYPILTGQFREYLILQLELFAAQHRGGTDYSHLMQHVAPKLTSEQIRAVASYYASLPWPNSPLFRTRE